MGGLLNGVDFCAGNLGNIVHHGIEGRNESCVGRIGEVAVAGYGILHSRYQSVKVAGIVDNLHQTGIIFTADGAEHRVESHDINMLLEVIKASRDIKVENNIKPSKEIQIKVEGFNLNDDLNEILKKMCKVNLVSSIEGETIVRPITNGNVFFKMDEIVNKEEELAKIDKELARLEGEIKRSNGILNNQSFLAKAPEAKINEEKTKLANYEESYNTLLAKKKEFN